MALSGFNLKVKPENFRPSAAVFPLYSILAFSFDFSACQPVMHTLSAVGVRRSKLFVDQYFKPHFHPSCPFTMRNPSFISTGIFSPRSITSRSSSAPRIPLVLYPK